MCFDYAVHLVFLAKDGFSGKPFLGKMRIYKTHKARQNGINKLSVKMSLTHHCICSKFPATFSGMVVGKYPHYTWPQPPLLMISKHVSLAASLTPICFPDFGPLLSSYQC